MSVEGKKTPGFRLAVSSSLAKLSGLAPLSVASLTEGAACKNDLSVSCCFFGGDSAVNCSQKYSPSIQLVANREAGILLDLIYMEL